MRNKIVAVGLMATMVIAGCGSQDTQSDKASSAASSAISAASETDEAVGENAAEAVAGENATEAVAGENATEALAGGNVTDALAGENGTDAVAGENATDVLAGENVTDVLAGDNATFTSAGKNVTETDIDEAMEEDTYDDMDGSESEQDPIMDIKTVPGEAALEDCIKVGDYKGLTLTKYITEVTDEDVDEYLSYQAYPVEIEDEDAELKAGDTATIDFVGTIDGEEFDDGTATDFDLEIGSGMFIEGFEDGLIGMKKGETKELDLVFPEDYLEDLAGKPVVFTVTVKAIKQVPEMNDDWAKENSGGEAETMEEYRNSIREQLEEENEKNADYDLKNDAWTQVLDASEVFQLPEDELEKYREDIRMSFDKEAEMYEMTRDEYLEEFGMTQEDFDEYCEVTARNCVKGQMAAQFIMDSEDITKESDEYRQAVDSLTEMYGMSEQDVRDEYGDVSTDQYLMTEAVAIYLVENASVTEEQISLGETSDFSDDDIMIEGDPEAWVEDEMADE